MLSDIRQDIRYGARMLLRAPTFTAMSVATLALGIGATTAIFSLVWAVVLAPLPYEEPDRLVRVWEVSPRGGDRNVVSAGNVLDWQERARSFSVLGAHTFPYPVVVSGEGPAFRVDRITVQPEVLGALGAAPALGRSFVPEDADAANVVLVGHAFWQDRLGSDPDVLGRRILLEEVPYTVVGVMPEGFAFPSEGVQLYRPFRREDLDAASRVSHNYQVVARLAPGATLESAQEEMARLAEQIAGEHPREMTGWSARVVPLHDDITRNVETLLWVLLGGVGVVLLITCANIANLLLARAVARQREIALRGALGAGRWRIVRQLLTESVLLTLAGGSGAVAVAPLVMQLLIAAAPADVPLLERAVIDARMLAFTAGTALSCALLFGLTPALRLARAPDLQAALRSGRDGSSAGHMRLRGALLAGQVALSVVLLVGAGLFVRSFRALDATELGFEPEGLVLMDASLPQASYPETQEQVAFYERLLDRVEALPGVASAAGSSQPPAIGSTMTYSFAIEGRVALNPSGREDDEPLHAVTAGYFEVLGQPVVSGRAFGPGDRADGAPVVILNEALARKHFPDGEAVGNRISFRPGETPWREIVGVVADVRLESPDVAPRTAIYIPFAQKSWEWLTQLTVVARAEPGYGDPAGLGAGLRDALLALDPGVPPLGIRTVEASFRENTARRSFAMTLVGGFGLLALVLSVVGLYGLITYSVARERREIGVRIALGAHASDVVGQVLRRALVLTAVGAAAGLVGAAGLSGLVAGLLFGVSPVDAITYAAAVLLMVAVALATTAAPAYRAARTDPMEAIRAD